MIRALLGILILSGCTGEAAPLGTDQPIRVHDATLRLGAMPGAPDAQGPRITAIESTGGVWAQGQLDRTLSGRASDDAWAIGIEVAGIGTGFWTLPVGALDPAFPGERSWDLLLDVGGGLPPGVHTLRVVAIDEGGRGGTWSELDVCVTDPRVPDNRNACDPRIPPPDAVIVLSWDSDVDLDLVVDTPEGKTVDARHPTTAYAGEGTVPPDLLRDPHVGRLDGDSLAECLPDGRRSESLTWQEPTQVPGLYHVYANLYDACGHVSVRFTVSVYRRVRIDDDTLRLAQLDQRSGILLGAAANGGAGAPLYVTTIDLP